DLFAARHSNSLLYRRDYVEYVYLSITLIKYTYSAYLLRASRDRPHRSLGDCRAIHRHWRHFGFLHSRDAQLLPQLLMDAVEGVAIVLEILPDVLASLADALAGVAEPRAGLLDDVVGHCQIQHIAFARDALAIQDVEFGITERRSHLVLHDLYLGARADHGISIFDGSDTADVAAGRGAQTQRPAARG